MLTVFIPSVDDRYEALLQSAAIRRQKLCDALSLHQLNRDANIVETWINEKVGRLYLITRHFDAAQS